MRSNLVPTESPRSNAFHLPFDLPAPSDSRFGFALVAVDRVDNVQLATEMDVTDPHSIAGCSLQRFHKRSGCGLSVSPDAVRQSSCVPVT